mgnify:CR=1 FL=1
MSEFVIHLLEENLRTKKNFLDLGNCGLNGKEDFLQQLNDFDHLETISFWNVSSSLDGSVKYKLPDWSLLKGYFNFI